MKKVVSLLLFIPLFALAQKKPLTHTVAPKESFTSIGRLYNVNGRELANFNKLDYDKGLAIGQVLKIPGKTAATAPAKATPVVKTPAVTNPAGGTPIYHTVAKKETLYHISTLYGKVPIADIKKWNNLQSDGVNEGARLIVGYKQGTPPPPAEEVVKEEPPVVKEQPVISEPQKTEPAVVKETPPVKQPVVRDNVNFNGGAFRNLFQPDNTNNETGTAGVFKSTSGWEDGKYYCLHNTAPEGSVIKITNASGRSVYARVLDVMPDIKQNSGLIILISNAAAAELGVGENKFDCTITYSK